jgi:hypothetical protein
MLERTTTHILNNSPARSNSFLSSRAASNATEWEVVTLSRSSSHATIRPNPNETAQHDATVPPLSEFSSALAAFAACAKPPLSPQLSTPLRAPTAVLQNDNRTKALRSSIVSSDDVDAEMLRIVQDLAKERDIPDWQPQVTQLKLPGVMESRVWISDAYTASRMSSLEIGPRQRVAHILFLCDNERLPELVKTGNPALQDCEDYPEKGSPQSLLNPGVLDSVCSWISKGSKGSDTMNHAVLLVSATGSIYAPAMALAYQIWSSRGFIPDISELVHKLSKANHMVRLDAYCKVRLAVWRKGRNDYHTEFSSYGRVDSQSVVLKEDSSWFWDGKYAPTKPMLRQDSGALEYVWHNM